MDLCPRTEHCCRATGPASSTRCSGPCPASRAAPPMIAHTAEPSSALPSPTCLLPLSGRVRMARRVARREHQPEPGPVAARIRHLSRELLALGFGATEPHEPEPGVLAQRREVRRVAARRRPQRKPVEYLGDEDRVRNIVLRCGLHISPRTLHAVGCSLFSESLATLSSLVTLARHRVASGQGEACW